MKKPTANQKNLLKKYKDTLCLSKDLFSVCVGVLLYINKVDVSDASIQTQNNGKSFRLKFQQADKLHREYLFHLYELFKDWVLSPPFFDEKRGIWGFQTISHPDFIQLAKIFVLDHQGILCKKHIKAGLIEQYGTASALAYWIMDDGGRLCYNKDYERKGFSLNTQSFTKEEVELLCKGLQNRYGLHCWVKSNKKKWIIAISGGDYEKVMPNFVWHQV